jgi:hypothetical protein
MAGLDGNNLKPKQVGAPKLVVEVGKYFVELRGFDVKMMMYLPGLYYLAEFKFGQRKLAAHRVL